MKLGVVGFYKTTPPIVGANREAGLIDPDKGVYKKLFPNNTIVVKEFKEYFDYKNQFEIFNEVFREFPPIDGYFEGKNDIVYSLLHMHMNRVGIFPYREKEYLYFVMYIAEALNNYEEFT